jgi:hypothetical protein
MLSFLTLVDATTNGGGSKREVACERAVDAFRIPKIIEGRAPKPVSEAKGDQDAQIQGYDATVEAAKRALEAAQNALSRDVGQAIGTAGWTFLRDKCDVIALVDVVSELANQPDFVPKLHAAADQARVQQPQRGRPPKPNGVTTDLNHAAGYAGNARCSGY